MVKCIHPAKERRVEPISMIVYNNHRNNGDTLSCVGENDSADLQQKRSSAMFCWTCDEDSQGASGSLASSVLRMGIEAWSLPCPAT